METGHRPRRSMSLERPLPSSSDTPYQSPRGPTSTLSSFGSSMTLTPLTTSPSLNGQHSYKSTNNDSDTQYDPQQFTPNLHASLVSKVLGLQQELESKRAYIDDVETSLSSSRAEIESLKESQRRVGKEKQALKRQVQLHEQNALSAVEVLSEERDQFKDANTELRKRLESVQKKVRTHEDDAVRLQSLLEQERTSAVNSKRTLERRAELAETRLQSVIEDLAASQTASVDNSQIPDLNSRPSSPHTERSLTASPDMNRFSIRQHHHSIDTLFEPKPSLADELNFDESQGESSSDEEPAQTPPRRSRASLEDHNRTRAQRLSKQQSPQTPRQTQENKFKADQAPAHPAAERGQVVSRPDECRSKVMGMVSAFEQHSKRDSTGTSESRRSSGASRSLSQSTRLTEPSGKTSSDTRPDSPLLHDEPESEYEHGVSHERAEVADKLEPFPSPQEQPQPQPRTLEGVPRLPRSRANTDLIPMLQKTPDHMRYLVLKSSAKSLGLNIDELDAWRVQKPSATTPIFESLGTQTDFTEPPLISKATQTETRQETRQVAPKIAPPNRAPPPPPTQQPSFVPAIAVHPPEQGISTSISPRRHGAPYRSRNTGVQTPSFSDVVMKSTAMQTEAIRVDKRPVKIPAHLLPSALDEKEPPKSHPPPTMMNKAPSSLSRSRRAEPLKLDKSMDSSIFDRNLSPQLPPLEESEDEPAYSDDRRASTNRSSKSITSPVSLHHPESSPYDQDEMDDLYPSDTEYSMPTGPKSSFSSRAPRTFEPPAPVPEDEKVVIPQSAKSSFDKKPLHIPGPWPGSSRMPFPRDPSPRSSLGSVASSSNYSKTSGPRPPFAIPTRKSSREQYAKIRIQRGNNTSPRRSGRSSPTKSSKGSQRLQKWPPSQKALRKARSEAAIESAHAVRPISALPPLPPATATERGGRVQSSLSTSHSARDLQNGKAPANANRALTSFPMGGASIGSAFQHDVEEAVAATSIGEWMFKYMRNRKTFGKAGETGKTNESRHRRWVWVLPYERAVVWSNKRPTNPAALMGKAGKKLRIKSVIDIKDITAPPKEAKPTGLFDHSIVILSDNNAALKLTAISEDRHYMWVKALSYIAHQSARHLAKPLPPPSMTGATSESSTRSRASSVRNHFRSKLSHPSSGVATPVPHQPSDPAVRRETKPPMPDSAFAPVIPRVPHSRKRSLTGPSGSSAPSRGRTNGRSNALCGYPVPTAHPNSLLAGTSSVRVQSVSGNSSRRSILASDEPALESDPPDENRIRHLDPSPRQSETADFGGNTNFFDAVGVVRMSAFSTPGPAGGNTVRGGGPMGRVASDGQVSSHMRQESSGDFIGPPDIGRVRRGENWKGF